MGRRPVFLAGAVGSAATMFLYLWAISTGSYPLTLLSSAIRAMQRALVALAEGRPAEDLLPFAELRRIVGFDDYHAEQARYAGD